jgi:hypothetical protein
MKTDITVTACLSLVLLWVLTVGLCGAMLLDAIGALPIGWAL